MVESVELSVEKFRACRDLREMEASQSEREVVCRSIDERWSEKRQVPINEAVAKLRKLVHGLKSSTNVRAML